MSDQSQDLQKILLLEGIKVLLSGDNVGLAQIDAAIALLVKMNIPFDLLFSPGGRRLARSFELVIYINPKATVHLVISLQGGASLFSEIT
jgi:hypothetical protein